MKRFKRIKSLFKNVRRKRNTAVFRGKYDEVLRRAKIYLKREDLNHTGAHKINNTIGQALLAVRMGKKKL